MGDVTRQLRTHGNLPAKLSLSVNRGLNEVLSAIIDDVADVGGGGTTAAVGLQLVDFEGKNIAEQHVLGFGVYDDTDAITAGVNATLNTATAGTILAGAASAELIVKTDANGRFACTLTDAIDEAVFLIASRNKRSPILDCRDVDSVTFSA